MQLYALDQQGKLTSARLAKKQTNYRCLECQQNIRLRGGPQRQPHFYHLDPTPFCRQHQSFLQTTPKGSHSYSASILLFSAIATR